MSRAVSSVLDVTVCLLLVSASVVTLTHAPAKTDDEADRADAILGIVATSTAWIEYPANGSGPNRTAHGTLATLLAAAAMADITVDGLPVAPSGEGFRRAVAHAVRRATQHPDLRVQVAARWRPRPDSRVRGRFVVGSTPPATADVHAASTTVPWESIDARERFDAPPEAASAASGGRVRLTVRTWSR